MELAGIAVDPVDVFELADRLIAGRSSEYRGAASPPRVAGDRVELDVRDREALIAVLNDTPDTLTELYDALVSSR